MIIYSSREDDGSLSTFRTIKDIENYSQGHQGPWSSRRDKVLSDQPLVSIARSLERTENGPKKLFDPNANHIPRGTDSNASDNGPSGEVLAERRYRSQRVSSQKPSMLHIQAQTKQTNDTSLPVSADPPPDSGECKLEPQILLQPETRPISHDQLVAEVKGIYAGLVMVEAKCIDVDDKQGKAAENAQERKSQLTSEQWQVLIALHKTLLHEHHDFFLASQHPSANPALNQLAAKYSMPARMWRHGIHAFLEVLRHRLPESLDHKLAFIYLAYSMMALLYETVPAFEDTWIECLGDLARYRMAIEDDDLQDREGWARVAKFWYDSAAKETPSSGRLYHHLAILARPYSTQLLTLYVRSLTCTVPFESGRASILSPFNPIQDDRDLRDDPDVSRRRYVSAATLLNDPSLFDSGKLGYGHYYPPNSLLETEETLNDFFKPAKNISRPLPEDFPMRGVVWTESYSPQDWFSDTTEDEDRPNLLLQRTKSNEIHGVGKRLLKKISKVKRGLASYVNGARLSVIADTGAMANVISAAYAKQRNMTIDTSSSSFELGNSSLVDSLGTVTIDYAFAEEPSKIFTLVCHVLPHCIYDLILGNAFLVATETMSKYRRRLTECIFSVANVFHLGFLGNCRQFLEGTLADQYVAYAIPDTGAERNVMDLRYVSSVVRMRCVKVTEICHTMIIYAGYYR